jgi:prepilin-type processing-associated H-X9-DG protein
LLKLKLKAKKQNAIIKKQWQMQSCEKIWIRAFYSHRASYSNSHYCNTRQSSAAGSQPGKRKSQIYWYDGSTEDRWSIRMYYDGYVSNKDTLKCPIWPTEQGIERDAYGSLANLPQYCMKYIASGVQNVKYPSEHILNADSNYTNSPGEKRQYASVFVANSVAAIHARHGRKANASYIDGHVEARSKDQLKENIVKIFENPTQSFCIFLGPTAELISF